MIESIVFYAAGFLTVLCIVLMILQTNPVASAICLVASFFCLAVVYVTLSAHFVAALQILVYAGAIMVLFIFVIMLLNLQDDEIVRDKLSVRNVVVFFVGLGLFALFVSFVWHLPAVGFKPVVQNFGEATEVSRLMLTEYVVPFEVLGILLLAGLVGAVMLGRRED